MVCFLAFKIRHSSKKDHGHRVPSTQGVGASTQGVGGKRVGNVGANFSPV